MAFYDIQTKKSLSIYQNGLLISLDPSFLDFTGNVDVSLEGSGVQVDITGGGAGSNIVTGEIVSGGPTTWTLAQTPVGSIEFIANGQVLLLTSDYTITGNVVTTVAPWTSGTVQATYHY